MLPITGSPASPARLNQLQDLRGELLTYRHGGPHHHVVGESRIRP